MSSDPATPPRFAAKLSSLRTFVAAPFRAIDEHHRRESLPSARAVAILITAAVALVLPHYFGRPRTFEESPMLRALAEGLPYPGLHPHLYWSLFKLVNYGLLPFLCIKLVLRTRLADHGLRLVREPKVWLLYAAMALAVLPITYLASTSGAFLRVYPKYPEAAHSLAQFLLWELGYGFQFLMLEFFFRGFLIFALARYVGSLAIFVMIVPYAMIHFGKPFAECLGSIVAGSVLGTIALRTGSIWGGVALHCAVAWSMDLFALAGRGELGRLLSP